MSEEQNTPIAEQNSVKNDNTKVEKHEQNMVPQSRVNELTAKNHKITEEFDAYRAQVEAENKKKLAKQGEFEMLYNEQLAENKTILERSKAFEADSMEFKEYKTKKRDNLMSTITDEMDIRIAKELPLNELELFAKKVGQTNAVNTPNQRPSNSNKGTGDFGGYESMLEWATKDPESYNKAKLEKEGGKFGNIFGLGS